MKRYNKTEEWLIERAIVAYYDALFNLLKEKKADGGY